MVLSVMLKIIIASCLVASAVQLHANIDLIDMEMEAELGPATYLYGQVEGQKKVFEKARNKFEAKLHSIYNLLETSLHDDDLRAIQQDQREWLVHRRNMVVLLAEIYSDDCSAEYQFEVMLLNRARVQELERFIKLVDGRGDY